MYNPRVWEYRNADGTVPWNVDSFYWLILNAAFIITTQYYDTGRDKRDSFNIS